MILLPINDSIRQTRALSNIYKGKEYFIGVLARGLMIILCFLVSLSHIKLIDFISLSGAFVNALIALIFPVSIFLIKILIYVYHFSGKNLIGNLSKAFHYGLMIFGTLLSIYSIFDALRNIVQGNHKVTKH